MIMMMGILVTRLFNTKIRQNHNSEYNKKLHLDFMPCQINFPEESWIALSIFFK
jgi:hypothetical protein